MATNTEQLAAVFNGLYDANATPEKLQRLIAAVVESLTTEEVAAKYPAVLAANLNENQKAWFVLDSLRAAVKNRVLRNAERKNMEASRAARKAARDAMDAEVQGL